MSDGWTDRLAPEGFLDGRVKGMASNGFTGVMMSKPLGIISEEDWGVSSTETI